jgi:Na+/proline symporter/nitrogen-specific signal transduction histidine kinase
MSAWAIILASLAYLGLLFGIAAYADRRARQGRSLISNPYAYALSLAVYCTAWTFYGSVGKASTEGLAFLPVYLGPTLMAPLWFIVLRKIIVICRSQRITSIADFIAARYGKSDFLGGLVAAIALIGVVPYISLQLKAIAFSFDILSAGNSFLERNLHGENFYQNTAFYASLILALFTILFGTRHLDPNERHEGLVAAIATESVVKLAAFLAVGIFVTYGMYAGPRDLFAQAAAHPQLSRLLTREGMPEPWDWAWITLLSMLAILLLPRQFHIAAIENTHPRHVSKAIWLFPLYLLLINLFVLPVAFGGILYFGSDSGVNADTYVLNLPLRQGQAGLALLVFIGGLSASTSMVIAATIALSIMVSNHLVLPLLLRASIGQQFYQNDLSQRIRGIRRLLILVILWLAYAYYTSIGERTSLVSIGLISFAAVAQFGPALLGGLFWKGASHAGAVAGLVGGFLVWAYTLPFPSLLESGYFDPAILREGAWGIGWLRPYALFGLEGWNHITHSAFWSLLVNVSLFAGISLYASDNALGRRQASLFVDIHRYSEEWSEPRLGKAKALLPDIQLLLHRFLGRERAEELLGIYAQRHRLNLDKMSEAGPELIGYAERLLAGAVGSASARLLISSVSQEDVPTVQEVMEVMDETRQILRYSQELERKSLELERASRKLQAANERLREMDQRKDDFITTVTHELRTPITSIRSLVSILHDNEDLPADQRQAFLRIMIGESERISRLINQVLDLEKMESGHAEWNWAQVQLDEVIHAAAKGVHPLCLERGIALRLSLPERTPPLRGDRDRLTQVLVNLLSNACKFCPEQGGKIEVGLRQEGDCLLLTVRDNGIGIAAEMLPYIFDKFTQFSDHRQGRPQGSGLGLSISQQIVRSHGGEIQVQSEPGKGADFRVRLPLA